jgi:hypothetical protein
MPRDQIGKDSLDPPLDSLRGVRQERMTFAGGRRCARVSYPRADHQRSNHMDHLVPAGEGLESTRSVMLAGSRRATK